MDTQQKIKDREALENAHENFVQPYIHQLIEVQEQSLPTTPVAISGLCCTSAWLALILVYCTWMRSQSKQ